jgi:hypothetical protein
MGSMIYDLLQNLRDYNYILPYAKAIEFCYLNSPLFKEPPYFKKYFLPFKEMRSRTYYYINDYHQYTLEMLKDDQRQKAVAIIYIFVVSPTDKEIDDMSKWEEHNELALLMGKEPVFQLNVFCYSDFIDLGIRFNEVYGYTYPVAFEEAMAYYDIKFTDDTKIAVFGAEFSR